MTYRKYRNWILGLAIAVMWMYLVFHCLYVHAATAELEIKTGPNKYSQRITYFAGFNVGETYGTGTYVYDPPAGAGVNDGWINVLGNPLAKATKVTVQIGVDTYTSGTLTARIEGRVGTSTRPCEILTLNYTAITSIDQVVPIIEGVTDIRVGWLATEAVADSVHSYALLEIAE